MNKHQAMDLIHAKIHGLRMIPKYKPSQFESDVGKLVSKAYQEECEECKESLETRELTDRLAKRQPQQKSGFLGGLFGG